MICTDRAGVTWHVEVAGNASAHRPGLARTEAVFRSLGRLAALRGRLGPSAPLLLLTASKGEPRSEAEQALRAAGPQLLTDVIDLSSPEDLTRLSIYASGRTEPLPGFWDAQDLAT